MIALLLMAGCTDNTALSPVELAGTYTLVTLNGLPASDLYADGELRLGTDESLTLVVNVCSNPEFRDTYEGLWEETDGGEFTASGTTWATYWNDGEPFDTDPRDFSMTGTLDDDLLTVRLTTVRMTNILTFN